MKIRPKIPIFQNGGLPSTVTWTDPNSNWFTRSGNNGILEGTYNMLKPLYDKWKSSGSLEDYLAYKKAVDALNTNQRYGYAPGHLRYQQGNNLLFKGYGTNAWQNYVRNNYSFINDVIGKNYSLYHVISSKPYSGDNEKLGWKVDDLWAGETDDRTTWGNLLNPNDPNYQNWKLKFSEIGIDYRTNPEWKTGDVLYGFLKEPELFKNNPPSNDIVTATGKKGSSVPVQHQEGGYGFDWNKIRENAQRIFNNPGLYSAGRLIGGLAANEHIYDEALKGIKPVLKQTYNTHRLVVGDEATKLGYYRRAAAGQTKAAQPFTSDADRQVAYMNEAKRIGDELRALGDLANNQEIRRTSDESNQHQWANTQRATEVANVNLESINRASGLKHNLLALKHAAQWSSIDNFLSELEYRKRLLLAEDLNLEDLLWMLNQPDFLYSKEYLTAYKNYNDTLEKHKKADGTYDEYNPEVIEARGKITELLREHRRKLLLDLLEYKRKRNSYLLFGKSGTKIKVTRKKKEDLLYKSGRDTVEHFRKMSKMSSDSYNRKTPKIEKLAPHPKGKARKFQQGGLAPFVVYKPVALGGETSRSISSESSSSKSSSKEGSDTLDMIKELFKTVVGLGLPSDVNSLYVSMLNFLSRSKAFGNELSTDDIASMYLQLMQRLNSIKYLKSNHDKAELSAILNDAINEFAVDYTGRLVALNDEGDIVFAKSLSELEKKGLNPLTNGQLLQLRATSPSLAGHQELDTIAANGIGISKIASYLKSQLPSIGSSEQTIEGYTKKESNDIKAGLQLLKDAPEGYYEKSEYSKTQLEQANAALNYLKGILPTNMRAIIRTRAELGGLSEDLLIGSLIGSGLSNNSSVKFTAVTGKAAKDTNGNSKESGDGLKLDAATALISGKGYLGAIEFNPGTSYAVTVNARHSGFLKKSGENMGSGITMLEATTSTLDKVLDWNKATLGGSRLNPTGYNRIMINSDDVVGVDLPIGSDKNTPDFTMLLKLQVLDLELLKKGIEDTPNNWKQVNQVCLEIGLPAKYKNDGSLNEYSWNRFAAFQVTADDSVLVDKNAILSDILGVVEDDNVREQYELIILKDNKNYKLGSGFLGLGKQALYLGTVFVPINSNYVASALSGGLNISMLQATNLELRERGYDLLKIATYKPGININEL